MFILNPAIELNICILLQIICNVHFGFPSYGMTTNMIFTSIGHKNDDVDKSLYVECRFVGPVIKTNKSELTNQGINTISSIHIRIKEVLTISVVKKKGKK